MENIIAERRVREKSIPKLRIKKKKLYKWGQYVWVICRFLLIFGLGFVILYPLLQILSKVFMPTSQYQDLSVIWIPKSLTLDNIKNAIEYVKFWPSLANTLILGLSCAAIQIIVYALTGYGFARFRFPLREPLFLLVILTIIVPTQIIFLPSFVQYRFFDFFGISRILGLITGKNYTEFATSLIDSRWSFWIPSFFGVGLRSGIFIYLFRQCFRNIPKELEEAAKIDGCGSITTFVRIMLPNAKSSILTVFLFSLVWHWNEYTLTKTFFPQKFQPLAVQLKLAIEAMVNDIVLPNVIVDLYWNPEGRDNFEMAALKRYEEKYGAGTVTVNVIGWNGGIEAMQQNIAAGTPSDLIFTEGNACFPSYVTKNYFQPITELVKQDMGSSFMDEASMNNFKYCDEYYVFTNSARTKPYLLAYYIPMFEENGLETPGELYAKGEWTWDKFLEYCDLLTVDTDGDGAIDQWGLGPRYKLQNFAYASGIIGIEEVGNGFLKSNWDNENMLKYFEFITKLEGIQARAEGNNGWLGIGAMYIEAINQEQLANRDENGVILGNNTDTSFVPLPTMDGSMATTPVWDNGYAIPNGSKNPLAGAVLASMILDEYAKGLRAEQEIYMTPEEITLYYECMSKSIAQRKNSDLYEGVTMDYGEAEAKEGTPAATIVDTYKNVVKTEVQSYNDKLMQKLGN